MKKIIAAAMTVVLLLPAGCSMLSGKTICLFNGSNILGMKSVLYKSGRIILDLDEAYADTENSEYADLISLVKNGTAEDRANFSLSVRTTCFTDFSDDEIKFDVSGLTVSVNAGDIRPDDMTYMFIGS